MSKNYFLVTSNHYSLSGISDHVKILLSIFEENNLNLKVSDDIVAGETNIIIDEFTNLGFNQRFKNLDLKKTRLVLVATEFITNKNNFKTFNSFEITWLNILIIKFLFPISIFFKYLWSFKVTGFKLNTGVSKSIDNSLRYVLKFIFFNVYKFFTTEKIRRYLYDYQRYKLFTKYIKYFPEIIVFHKELHNHYSLFVKNNNLNINVLEPLYPIIENKVLKEISNKKYSFFMSGTPTNFRFKQFDALKKIISFGLLEDKFFNVPFCDFFFKAFEKDTPNYLFSYHPTQTSEWKFSSPIRIYRSLSVDYSIPIVDKYFHDHPIEKLCLKKDDQIYLTTKNLYLKKKSNYDMVKLLNEYNSFSLKNNRKILGSI